MRKATTCTTPKILEVEGVKRQVWRFIQNMNKLNIEHWEQICADTAIQMLGHIAPFTTPISCALSENEGEHLGTGSYFEVEGRKYIITNEHVARHLKNNPLTHKFFNDDNIFRLTNPAIAEPAPIDVAISRIEERIWNFRENEALAIPFNRFAKKHAPFQHELLFFAGYSGERSKFLFGHLITPGTPYLTQECPFPKGVDKADPIFHFALLYNPALAKSIDGSSHLPVPHGFSGSLIWDTKRVACLQAGSEWSPELAEVTGIVWGWPSSALCILATKVEHLKLTEITNVNINNA